MSQTPSATCPATIFAGDTIDFAVAVSGCSTGDGFTASFIFQSADGRRRQTVAGVDYGGQWRCTASSATTQAWAAGDYQVYGFAVDGTDRRTFFTGQIRVCANVYASGNVDIRSENRKNLDNIRLVLAGRANHDILATTINGQQLQMLPVADLMRLATYFEQRVAQEEAAADSTGRLARRSKIVPVLPA